MNVEDIRMLVAQGKYEFSKHAEREREIDMICTWELEDALGGCEIIESYPDDLRGASPSGIVSDSTGQAVWC